MVKIRPDTFRERIERHWYSISNTCARIFKSAIKYDPNRHWGLGCGPSPDNYCPKCRQISRDISDRAIKYLNYDCPEFEAELIEIQHKHGLTNELMPAYRVDVLL